LAQQYHLQQGEVREFAKGAGGAPLGGAPPLQERVFGEPPLAVGKVGGPLVLGDDRLVLVKVLERHPAQVKPLAEVRDRIVAAITKEQSTQAALKAAQEAHARLAAGASFDAVAQQLRVSADPAHFIGRHDPSIPAQVRDAAFAMPTPAGKSEFRAVALNDGGAAVVAVSAVRVAAAHDPETRKERSLEEAQRLGTADALAYIEEVRRTADVRKNPKAFE
jgi:peptidyl-prolyl cis-trans isomerase D